MIFDLFDHCPADQACLGLTCKTLYPLYRERHKTVSLFERTGCDTMCEHYEDGLEPHKHPKVQLHMQLKCWMPADYAFSKYVDTGGKFIPRERLAELYGMCQFTLEIIFAIEFLI